MSDAENAATSKSYSGYLIVDWREDDVRYRKTPPSDDRRAPHEIAIPVSVDVQVPEVTVPRIEADIEIPPAEVEQAVAEAHGDQEAEFDDE